jgi:hypothetical protein
MDNIIFEDLLQFVDITNEDTSEIENIKIFSDEIFFSNKINCITFFGVLCNTRSSFFLKSNVINPYYVYNKELYACGLVMKK